MAGKFELKISKNGKYFFNLLAGNGQIILLSEMYESKTAAENGIASVQKKFWRRWALRTIDISNRRSVFYALQANGQEISEKSEMYKSAASMENGIASVKANATSTPIVEAQAGISRESRVVGENSLSRDAWAIFQSRITLLSKGREKLRKQSFLRRWRRCGGQLCKVSHRCLCDHEHYKAYDQKRDNVIDQLAIPQQRGTAVTASSICTPVAPDASFPLRS